MRYNLGQLCSTVGRDGGYFENILNGLITNILFVAICVRFAF